MRQARKLLGEEEGRKKGRGRREKSLPTFSFYMDMREYDEDCSGGQIVTMRGKVNRIKQNPILRPEPSEATQELPTSSLVA